MPILQTAKNHFDTDVGRAKVLMMHAETVPACQDDMLRSALMFAVGACDAYFADAYADMIVRALRAKQEEPTIMIPDRLNNLKIPVTAILRPLNVRDWRWRMAARELVEKENVLSFSQIRSLFNQFFPNKRGLLSRDRIITWMSAPLAKRRQFGITAAELAQLAPGNLDAAKDKVAEHFEKRFDSIFQRRHDCIHCCDRPKFAVRSIKLPAAQKKIEDIEFLVNKCHEELVSEFERYLRRLNFSSQTRNQVMS